MIVEIVPSALHGERVDRIVAFILDVSRSVASGLVERGAVHVDGGVETSGKVRLVEGHIGRSPLGAAKPARSRPHGRSVVVHVDEHVIVVDKHAGLVVHPGAGNDSKTLVNGLLAEFPEIATLVNHIDRALCIVLTPAAPVCSSLHEPNMRTTNLFPGCRPLGNTHV